MSGARISGLDGLRAVACFSVMAFHAQIPGFGHGWLGVDVFFLLSGYLTVNQLRRSDPRRWLRRRWARLHPALVAVCLPVGIVAVMGGAPIALPLAGAFFIYLPFVMPVDGGLFGHLWSINVEVAWYLTAAVLVRPLTRFVPAQVLATVFLLLAFGSLMSSSHLLNVVRPEGLLIGAAVGWWAPVALQRTLRPLGAVLSVRPLRAMGLRTYSLYLWHLPVFEIFRHHTDLALPVEWVAEFAVALLLAEASYRLVEIPCGQRLRGDSRSRQGTILAIPESTGDHGRTTAAHSEQRIAMEAAE